MIWKERRGHLTVLGWSADEQRRRYCRVLKDQEPALTQPEGVPMKKQGPGAWNRRRVGCRGVWVRLEKYQGRTWWAFLKGLYINKENGDDFRIEK